MVRATLLILAYLLASTSSWGADVKPEEFIREVIDAFNSEDLARYQSKFHYPYSRINNGQIQVLTDATAASVDYAALRRSGWVRSQINELEVLDQGDNSAIVRMNFSRVNAEGQPYLTSNFFYTLTKSDGGWKVISWSIARAVAGGPDSK